MEYRSISIADAIQEINRTYYLPAIQREFVWGPDRIEKLFDSLMSDFPIGSFLFWKVDRSLLSQWAVYEFVRNYDKERPHNDEASLAGTGRDVELILDGQQRLTALHIGLRGSYRYFHYRWRKTVLHLNLLKKPQQNEDDPEELTYQFAFRESDEAEDQDSELWYPVHKVLDFKDPEDAKADIEPVLLNRPETAKDNARRLVGRLHTRIHTFKFINFHEETTPDYDKVLNIFVRTNSGGVPLEYSDLLLSTATAKWANLDARKEINDFSDELNGTGAGYDFGKDFVLKGCLYLTPPLPIQYMVKNFTRPNLLKIEDNWEQIRTYLAVAARLVSKFGFSSKNIISQVALLPVGLYLMRRGNKNFADSSQKDDVEAQVAIRRWLVRVLLRNAFGSSSDRMLKNVQDVLVEIPAGRASPFPAQRLSQALSIDYPVSDDELDGYVRNAYQGKYTFLILSLLYPDRDWKNAVFHEDHIFPKTEFEVRKLRKRGYDDDRIKRYVSLVNLVPNLELLTDSENLEKNAKPFDKWFETRDADFQARHLIPKQSVGFDEFESFCEARRELLKARLAVVLAG